MQDRGTTSLLLFFQKPLVVEYLQEFHGQVLVQLGSAFFGKLQEFHGTVQVQLGSVFPDASAVYFHCWRAIVEHDGSDSMFCSAFWCVFGFGWAC